MDRGKARVSRDFPTYDFVWEAKGNEYDVETGTWAPPRRVTAVGGAPTQILTIFIAPPNIGCLPNYPK